MLKDGNRKGYTITLNQFWSVSKINFKFRKKPIATSTFCEARMKIKPKVFRKMVTDSAIEHDKKYNNKFLWRNFRVLAVDGSKYTLPASNELINDFGCQSGSKKDAHYPQALISMLFNVKSKIVYDASIQSIKGNERTELVELLSNFKIPGKNLIILDRGYPSYQVLMKLFKNKINFLIRLPATHTFKIVDSFNNSNSIDKIYKLKLPNYRTVKVRLLKIIVDGMERIFITSMISKRHYSHKDLTDLYYERWEIEEQFKKNKELYIVEKFHSKKTNGIKQEIYAQLFLYNFTRLACTDAAILDEEDEKERIEMIKAEGNKIKIKEIKGEPAFKNAFMVVERSIDGLLANLDSDNYKHLYLEMLEEIRNVRYIKRKDRHFPRESKSRFGKWKKRAP